jgi:hypothetical protein
MYLTASHPAPVGPNKPTEVAVLPPQTAPSALPTAPSVPVRPLIHPQPALPAKRAVQPREKVAAAPTETVLPAPSIVRHQPVPIAAPVTPVQPAPRPVIHPQPIREKIANKPSTKPHGLLTANANIKRQPDFVKPPMREPAPETVHPAPAPETHVAALPPPSMAPTSDRTRPETVTPEPAHVRVAAASDDLLGSVRRTVVHLRELPTSPHFGTAVKGTLHTADYEAGSGHTTPITSIVYSDINHNH